MPAFGVDGFLRRELNGTGILVRRGGVGRGVTATVVGGFVGGFVRLGVVVASSVVVVVTFSVVVVGSGVVVGGFVTGTVGFGVGASVGLGVGGAVAFGVVEMISICCDSIGPGKNGGSKKVVGGF